MRAVERGALGGLPRQAGRRGGRSGGDAPDRRTASRTSVLRLAAHDLRTQQGRPWAQPQTGAAADAGDGDRGAGSAPRHEQSRARTQDIPLPAARPEDCRAEPRVGGRRDLYPDGVRLPLSGGDHRLGQPGGSGMAAVEHQRCQLLRGGARGGAASVRTKSRRRRGLRICRYATPPLASGCSSPGAAAKVARAPPCSCRDAEPAPRSPSPASAAAPVCG